MKSGDPKAYPDARLQEYCQRLHEAVTAQQPRGWVYVFTSFDKRTLKIMKPPPRCRPHKMGSRAACSCAAA